MIKKFILVFLAFAATLMLIAFVLPAQYQLSKSIETQSECELTSNYLLNLKNWENWAPWTSNTNSSFEHKFSGDEGKENQIWNWNSEENGDGIAQVIKIDAVSNSLEIEVNYNKPILLKSIYHIDYEPTGNGTLLTVKVTGELSYPIGRFFGFFLSSALEKNLIESLEKLSKILDQKEELNNVNSFDATIY